MSEENLRPWDIWLKNNPEPVLATTMPPGTNTPVEINSKEVRPWDLLNPKKGRADDLTQEERLAICKKCPSYRKFVKQCKECGCIMPAKVKLAEAFCPLGKWQAVEGIE